MARLIVWKLFFCISFFQRPTSTPILWIRSIAGLGRIDKTISSPAADNNCSDLGNRTTSQPEPRIVQERWTSFFYTRHIWTIRAAIVACWPFWKLPLARSFLPASSSFPAPFIFCKKKNQDKNNLVARSRHVGYLYNGWREKHKRIIKKKRGTLTAACQKKLLWKDRIFWSRR